MPSIFEKRYKTKELAQTGLYVGAVHNEDGLNRFFICLLRGLMVFLACYGTIVGLVEAFHIPYNPTAVTIAFLFISLFASFLYYNRLVFYIGYFTLFFGFTYCLGRFFPYANSGFQAATNIIYEEYSDYFKLLSLRESLELIENRYITVTVAMILIGTFLAILLNVTISGYMNLLETILITFPFLEIAFYIEKRPPLYCLMMLVAVYMCVGIQQASRHFKMQVKSRRTPEYLRFRKKKNTTYNYQSSAKGTMQNLLFSLAIAAFIGFGFYNSYYSEVPEQPTNAIKKTTDEYVKTFVQAGFSGLLNRYDSTGGLNHGRLGGISSIRPDFETDLVVTFAPYSYDTVYLKSFTGSHYNSNQWMEHAYLNTYPEAVTAWPEEVLASSTMMSSENAIYMTKDVIASYDAQYFPQTESAGKMEILNLDAGNEIFLPYYSAETNCIINQGENYNLSLSDGTSLNEMGTPAMNGIMPSPEQPAVTVQYSPYLGHYDDNVEPYVLPEYYDLYVHEFCLQVPAEIRPTLETYCVEQEFPGVVTSEFAEAPTDPEDVNAYRLAVAQAIYEHYVADFDYTMSPGTTPYREDFVEYFLTSQKRGVCAHFAASATMLLRTMGVPARYVEGYCIPLSVMSEGQGVDAEYSQWYQGPSQVTEEGVLMVNVTDAQAHAWVEIYLEGYGFVPFEVTPPDFMDETPLNFNFGGLFENLFNAQLPNANFMGNNYTPEDFDNNNLSLLNFSFKTSATPFLIMLGAVGGVVGLLLLGRFLYMQYKKRKLLKEENYAELIYGDYVILSNRIIALKELENPNPLPDELCKWIKEIVAPGDFAPNQLTQIDEMFDLLEKSLYAPKRMNLDEYRLFKLYLKNVYELMKTARKQAKKTTK